MTGSATRTDRGDETRDVILTTAERLFAEHGVAAVSNRQIGEAAGQSNNFAVGYHFGTKTDLVLAVVHRHSEPTERRRIEMLAALDDSSGLHDLVTCLVQPLTDHLAGLGHPTWYARFSAQVTTDPALRRLVVNESLRSPSIQQTLTGIHRLTPVLPKRVREERSDMIRHLIVHTCAERERALHEGATTTRTTWKTTASGLIDAIVGLWLAPVTPIR